MTLAVTNDFFLTQVSVLTDSLKGFGVSWVSVLAVTVLSLYCCIKELFQPRQKMSLLNYTATELATVLSAPYDHKTVSLLSNCFQSRITTDNGFVIYHNTIAGKRCRICCFWHFKSFNFITRLMMWCNTRLGNSSSSSLLSSLCQKQWHENFRCNLIWILCSHTWQTQHMLCGFNHMFPLMHLYCICVPTNPPLSSPHS